MRSQLSFLLLLAVKTKSRILFRIRLEWLAKPPDPWADLRILAILNHTSLFEPIFAAVAPNRLLWQIAAHGVVPVADKTLNRPLVGRFFRLVARHVVSITRERDQTWQTVLGRIHDPEALVVILPEGRLLLAYSGGLHHIHAPGDRWPRLFRRADLRLEIIDIAAYRRTLAGGDAESFKAAVIEDLTRRRDEHCPTRSEREARAGALSESTS